MKSRTRILISALIIALVMAVVTSGVVFASDYLQKGKGDSPQSQKGNTVLSVAESNPLSIWLEKTDLLGNAPQPGAGFTDTDGDGLCDYCGFIHGTGFTDADGDGICDYYGTNCRAGFLDANGDGLCDYCGLAHSAGFRDEDGDGVCDNYSVRGGTYYRDANNNGFCDNYEARQSAGANRSASNAAASTPQGARQNHHGHRF